MVCYSDCFHTIMVICEYHNYGKKGTSSGHGKWSKKSLYLFSSTPSPLYLFWQFHSVMSKRAKRHNSVSSWSLVRWNLQNEALKQSLKKKKTSQCFHVADEARRHLGFALFPQSIWCISGFTCVARTHMRTLARLSGFACEHQRVNAGHRAADRRLTHAVKRHSALLPPACFPNLDSSSFPPFFQSLAQFCHYSPPASAE